MPFLRGIADLGLEALDFCGLHRVNVVADLRKNTGTTFVGKGGAQNLRTLDLQSNNR